MFVAFVCILYAVSVSAFAPLGLRQRSHFASVGLKSCPSLLKMSSETPLTPPSPDSEVNDVSASAVEPNEGQSQPQVSAVEVGLKERQAIMAAEAENSPAVLAGKALNFVLIGYIAYLFLDSIRLLVVGATSGPPPA